MEVGTPDQALAEAIFRCATYGVPSQILNPDRDVVWEIEPDIKFDQDDLTFPVLVHMRGGIPSDLHILQSEEVA